MEEYLTEKENNEMCIKEIEYIYKILKTRTPYKPRLQKKHNKNSNT